MREFSIRYLRLCARQDPDVVPTRELEVVEMIGNPGFWAAARRECPIESASPKCGSAECAPPTRNGNKIGNVLASDASE